MFTITFIVVAVFILLAVIFWGRGLVNFLPGRRVKRGAC